MWERMGEILHRITLNARDQSFAEFVDQVGLNPLDREMALGFIKGFDAADPAVASAQALLVAELSAEKEEGDSQSRLTSGYGTLVNWLGDVLQAAGASLHLQTVVRRIVWATHNVEVHADTESGGRSWRADRALITLPLGVLKSGEVTFQPALAEKAAAVGLLAFGNARKLILSFREAWWPGKADFGFVHSFAEPFPTWWSDPRAPVLTGWSGGPNADRLIGCSPIEVEQAGLETLSRIFTVPISRLRGALSTAHTYDWAQDPFARGAYSYIPVSGLELPKRLAEPLQDTLFFVGEATALDAQMGTVFGALESGLRAAEEMSRTLSN
jgi:monoamine oxidase